VFHTFSQAPYVKTNLFNVTTEQKLADIYHSVFTVCTGLPHMPEMAI